MHIILANEIADVDLAEFEKIGYCQDGVIAVPTVDLNHVIKGMRAHTCDSPEDYQNTLSLQFESMWDERGSEDLLLEDPFEVGIIYRRKKIDYAELKYAHRLGALTLCAYFLVNVNDCLFGYQEEHETHTDIDYAFLWKEGLVSFFA